jgi:hypothetical protein
MLSYSLSSKTDFVKLNLAQGKSPIVYHQAFTILYNPGDNLLSPQSFPDAGWRQLSGCNSIFPCSEWNWAYH